MLKQASVAQLRSEMITPKHGHVVIAMALYPRGIRRELRSEFSSALGAPRALLQQLKEREPQVGHDQAFLDAGYETEFALNDVGYAKLKELAELSRTQDVYLVCQCALGQRCHRELLLILARKHFFAEIDRLHHEYAVFEARA